MSRIFGAMMQQDYVVPDIEAGMQHWLMRSAIQTPTPIWTYASAVLDEAPIFRTKRR